MLLPIPEFYLHTPPRSGSLQLAARAVALIYNWWSLFVRLAHPEARREAITSRPWLMTSVGRKTEHAGQTTVTLTGLRTHFEQARAALTRVSDAPISELSFSNHKRCYSRNVGSENNSLRNPTTRFTRSPKVVSTLMRSQRSN